MILNYHKTDTKGVLDAGKLISETVVNYIRRFKTNTALRCKVILDYIKGKNDLRVDKNG